VYVVDASRQSDRVSGQRERLCRGRWRITLNDNLLKRCSLPGIEATMGHEMGHYVFESRVSKGLAFDGIGLVLMFCSS